MGATKKQKLERTKNRRAAGAFVPIPVSISRHPNYINLNGNALKLLLDMCFQLRFKEGGAVNNGDVSIAWSLMRVRGWKSKETLRRAELELLYYGFIEMTRQGGRNRCNLYAITWLAIDECGGKLDIKATRAPRNCWQTPRAPYKHGMYKK